MAALSEDEEFEFRLRAEQEAKAAPAPSTDAQKLAQGIPVRGTAGVPDAAAPPASPSWSDDPMGALKQRVLQPVNNATEAAIRGVGGAVTGTLGGITGMLDAHPSAPGVKPMDAESHAQEANDEYQRLVDRVIGPQSQGSKDMLQSVGEHLPREAEALTGMSGEMGALSAAARGARLPPVPGIPGAAKLGEVVDRARGVPATAEAEALRARSLADASGHAARARDAAQQATQQATRAGLDAEHAGAWGAAAQHNLDNAAKIGDSIEQQLLAKPTMSKDELGAMMRAAGTTLRDEKIKARRAAAGYDQATAQDGAKIVPTDAARKVIEAEQESLKNPNLRATLERVNKELAPGKNATPTILGRDGKPLAPTTPQGLTLTQAESLRDYLNDAIEEKSGSAGATAADKSSERALLKIKDALTEQMEATSPLWKQANKNFRDASRGELDHLTGKGDLAKTLQTDSLSGQYMQTEAQVTGHIIAKANAGSPVLEMLAKKSPEIKDAARMYYTGELFGKGALPTPAVMETFVKTNERSLKQLGLYDEFKDIASAQRARAKTAEDFKRQAAEADHAEKAATRQESAANTQAAKHQRVADRFAQFQTEIANLPPKQLPGQIKSLGKAFQDEGLISQEQYGQMIRESDSVAGSFESADKTAAAIRRVGRIIGYGGAGVVGEEVLRRAL